jgi:hypothetical protein
MIPEIAIVVRPLSKSVSKIELDRLAQAQKAGVTTFWTSLSIGVDLYTHKSKLANAYYVLMVSDEELVGYLLLTKAKVDSGYGALAGWTVAHTYLVPSMQKIGVIRRVYDLILTKGRLIASSTQTPTGATMWLNRIKTDNRNFYLLFSGLGDLKTLTVIDSHNVVSLKDSIWDGDHNTILLCAPKSDTKAKKVIRSYAQKTLSSTEIAFKITSPKVNSIPSLFRDGDNAKSSGDLDWVKTNDSRIEVGYELNQYSLLFYIFLDGICSGELEFEFAVGKKVQGLFKAKVATPHAIVSPKLQGLGYSSFIYAKALTSGYTLITDEHTKEAADLWDRLSKKTGAHLGYLEPSTGEVSGTPTKTSYKVMSLDPTFGLKPQYHKT